MNQQRKTVLVTGASRGIGRACALKFAQEGWQVVITCVKNEALLLETAEEIRKMGVPCLTFLGDMGVYSECERLFEAVKAQGWTIDALINNSGISLVGLLQDLSIEDWNRTLQTNLTSVFALSKLAIPDMVRGKAGAIVNISSVWGVAGASCEVAYSATKGGINAFTKALGKELAPSGITVNAIACGAVDTDMNRWMTPEEKEDLLEEIPAGRMCDPSEVADLAFDLATSHSYLTAQVIQLDGGWI